MAADTASQDCIVCRMVILGPVWQCENGHLICSECRMVLWSRRKCPVCQTQTLFASRNLAIEQVWNKNKMTCPFECGLKKTLLREAMAEHVDLHCPNRIIHCPFRDEAHGPDCKDFGSGTAQAWIQHVLSSHTGDNKMHVLTNSETKGLVVDTHLDLSTLREHLDRSDVNGQPYVLFWDHPHGKQPCLLFLRLTNAECNVSLIGLAGRFLPRVELTMNHKASGTSMIWTSQCAPQSTMWMGHGMWRIDMLAWQVLLEKGGKLDVSIRDVVVEVTKPTSDQVVGKGRKRKSDAR